MSNMMSMIAPSSALKVAAKHIRAPWACRAGDALAQQGLSVLALPTLLVVSLDMVRVLSLPAFHKPSRGDPIACLARQEVLSAARNLACRRARHYRSSQPIYVDPYASCLCNEQARCHICQWNGASPPLHDCQK